MLSSSQKPSANTEQEVSANPVEPAYEASVAAAGIDGNTDFHIDEQYGCPVPPCEGGWDFPSVSAEDVG